MYQRLAADSQNNQRTRLLAVLRSLYDRFPHSFSEHHRRVLCSLGGRVIVGGHIGTA
jgi:hypothetical protein